jgi:CheY-like chemotaxis protein
MKVMIIDFAETDHIAAFVPSDVEIVVEKKDGNAAYKMVGEELPDVILINYQDKPSHGRQTAMAIKKRKASSKIPIYFIDGTAVENEQVKDIGLCIKSKALSKIWPS